MRTKQIKTSYGTYDVECIEEHFEYETQDVFSCENNCKSCVKLCDVGRVNLGISHRL